MVTFCWHWNSPVPVKPDALWCRGFYTESTDFDVDHAVNHPDSTEYQLLLRDIDAICVQLARLRDAGVPVRFRPLHEAEGGWVWNSASPDWYPGDDVVDAVSADVYEPDHNHNPLSSHYEASVALVGEGKLVALSENGPVPDPRLQRLHGSVWSWFNVWSADRLTAQNSQQHLRAGVRRSRRRHPRRAA